MTVVYLSVRRSLVGRLDLSPILLLQSKSQVNLVWYSREVIASAALGILAGQALAQAASPTFSTELVSTTYDIKYERLFLSFGGRKVVASGGVSSGVDGFQFPDGKAEGFPSGSLARAQANSVHMWTKFALVKKGSGYELRRADWADGEGGEWETVRTFDGKGSSLDPYSESRITGLYAKTVSGTTRVLEISGSAEKMKASLYAFNKRVTTASFKAAKAKPLWTSGLYAENLVKGRYSLANDNYPAVTFTGKSPAFKLTVSNNVGSQVGTLAGMTRLK